MEGEQETEQSQDSADDLIKGEVKWQCSAVTHDDVCADDKERFFFCVLF